MAEGSNYRVKEGSQARAGRTAQEVSVRSRAQMEDQGGTGGLSQKGSSGMDVLVDGNGRETGEGPRGSSVSWVLAEGQGGTGGWTSEAPACLESQQSAMVEPREQTRVCHVWSLVVGPGQSRQSRELWWSQQNIEFGQSCLRSYLRGRGSESGWLCDDLRGRDRQSWWLRFLRDHRTMWGRGSIPLLPLTKARWFHGVGHLKGHYGALGQLWGSCSIFSCLWGSCSGGGLGPPR